MQLATHYYSCSLALVVLRHRHRLRQSTFGELDKPVVCLEIKGCVCMNLTEKKKAST